MINTKLISIAEYNRRYSPKVLGGWLPVYKSEDEFVIRCASCLRYYTTEDIDAIYDGDVEIYGITCGKCNQPIWGEI